MEFIVKFEKDIRICSSLAGFRHIAEARNALGLPKLSERAVYGWIQGLRIGSIYIPEGFVDTHPELKDVFWNTREVVVKASEDALAPFVCEKMSVRREDSGAVEEVIFSFRLDERRFLEAWGKAGCPKEITGSNWFDNVEEE